MSGSFSVSGRLTVHRLAAIAAVAAAIVATYFDVVGHLVYRWSHEEDYSHGFLVPLFSGWLLWKRREILASATEPVRGRWMGLALLAVSAVHDSLERAGVHAGIEGHRDLARGQRLLWLLRLLRRRGIGRGPGAGGWWNSTCARRVTKWTRAPSRRAC